MLYPVKEAGQVDNVKREEADTERAASGAYSISRAPTAASAEIAAPEYERVSRASDIYLRPAPSPVTLEPNELCERSRSETRALLHSMVRAGKRGVDVASLHAQRSDTLLARLFESAASKVAPQERCSLLAVGGYGRGLLGLHSDLDVIILCEAPGAASTLKLIEALLYPLWDSGIEIGHAVRAVPEIVQLAREDLCTASALLDIRFIAGDEALRQELVSATRRNLLDPALDDILDSLVAERERRRSRFGGSRFLLEPELKNGCGGLRDLDVVTWSATARWNAHSIEEALSAGALLSREADELVAAREFFWRIRNYLHLRAARRQDRLTFEDQEDVSVQMGFVDSESALGVEQFMQSYYRHARIVERAADQMLARARPARRRHVASRRDLGDGTMIFDGQLTFSVSEALDRDPALALRLYVRVANHDLAPYSFARDAIAQRTADPDWCARLRADPRASEHFLDLLTRVAEAPVRDGSMLTELHEVGLLLAMIPEFEPVMGRVQHDVYHVYTVDVHSIAAVDRLRALYRGEFASEMPTATTLVTNIPNRTPLFLSVLLHDVGKGRQRSHSEVGAELSDGITARLGIAEPDRRHIRWLIAEHLSLYHWATRRDIYDAATITELSQSIESMIRLRELYLLTVVDLSTTNPKAMTAWKAGMLEQTYFNVSRMLEHGSFELGGRVAEIKRQVLALANDEERASCGNFLDTMPNRYFFANRPEVIVEHARIAASRGERMVHVVARPGPSPELTEVVMALDDRPGLLADVAAAFASGPLDITTAQIYDVNRAEIYTRSRAGLPAEAFDVFHVRNTGAREGMPLDGALIERILRDLRDLIEGKIGVQSLLDRRSAPPAWLRRKSPSVKTEVLVSNEISGQFTVVDVFARDQVGLLHQIASALNRAAIVISLSKVSTEGDRAVDVFYVTEKDGSKLSKARCAELAATLRSAIEQLPEA